ncbi:MAG: carboxypeptidase regulatory-like domain-containing protein [Thermoplasmata archaeon]|nr:carboxypeptidase regulatory-like domain-containing protein [Thermoplasmata archaeon]
MVRSLFAWSIFQQYGWLYIYAGGSDSYYHSRVTQYIILNHTNLVRDMALRYPVGAINPREPLFDWMNAVLGILFQGFFPGATPALRAQQAGAFFLDFQAPLWAGIGVFPVYLIGKEVSSKRTGLIGALLYPFIVANIDSSGLGYANYLTFYTAVILFTAYAYLRTVKATSRRRWVVSYRKPREFLQGLRQFWTYERTAVKWAVLTGVLFGTLALAWQGYPFFIAIMVVFLIIQFLIERIRHVDSFGLYVVTWIVGLVGFPMAMPYYLAQGLFANWFDAPLLLFFGVLLLLLPFLLLRDYPWVVSVPVFVIGMLGAAALFYAVDPTTFATVITGQGYFVKTLVYTTVAEAQAPSIDSLILGYGVITFFLAFAGLILVAIRIARQRFRRDLVFFFAFCVVSIYLPITAAKFFLVGSPVYALLPAEVLVLLLDVAGYTTLRRNIASLSDRRSQASAFRRSFKARHVLVMVVVLVILVPNVWYAIDAGIPGNSKTGYNLQVYNTLPPPLRTSPANASSYYLGAAGTSLDTPNQYDEAGYNWLATQDTNLPMYDRPAFISWWDYGFQAIDEGLHPSVADNFQNGIDPAGNFLLSQNESQSIAILAVELLAAEQTLSHQPYLPSNLDAILAHDGVNLRTLHALMVNTSADVPLVIAHPERYLPVSAANLDRTNAMYMATSWFLGETLSLSGVAKVYDDVQAYTGWAIRYAMVDSRLFPFSGQSTGIFYAPADLTDRVISSGGVPTTYYTLSVLGSDGNTYTAGSVPPGVQAAQVNIGYSPAFYNTMLYHIFIGYNGTEVGQGQGIPGLSGAVSSNTPEPGWMLQHFQVVYRTAYYCPYANPSQHPGCYGADNLPDAVSSAHAHNGSVDASTGSYFNGGETMLEYYSGQPFVGTVELPGGTPVSSVRLTVYDSWNIPHMTTLTGANGSFALDLPPGDDTVNVTTGTVNGLTQAGATLLRSIHIDVPSSQGFAVNPPPLVQNVVLPSTTVSGFVYFNDANNSTYQPAADRLAVGATVNLFGAGLPTYTALTDASGSYQLAGISPGVYSFTIGYAGAQFPQTNVFATTGKVVNETVALSPGQLSGFVVGVSNITKGLAGATVTLSSARGAVQQTITDLTGLYTLRDIVPGNYTVRASVGGTSLISPAIPEIFTAAGGKAKLNLTLFPTLRVQLIALASGVPQSGVPVRFTQIEPLGPAASGNNTTSTAPGVNSTVVLTGPDGTLTALLPAGNYSIYGAALLGTQWFAGLASAYLPRASVAGSGVLVLPPLSLSPAVTLTGTVVAPASSPSNNAFGIPITAYNAHGDGVLALANQSGGFRLLLPPNHYAVEAIQAPTSTSSASSAALAQVNLTYSTDLRLPLVPGFLWQAQAGASLASAPSFWPAAGATVSVSTGPGTTPVTTVANGNGTARLVLPLALPSGRTYCVAVSALGFEPYSQCGLPPQALAGFSDLAMHLSTEPVNINFVGYPPGTTLRLNLSATAAPAQSTSVLGGPRFNLTLDPGAYQLTAWAPYPNGTGVLQPPHPVNFSVPFGYAQTNLTVILLHQLGSVGTLQLPSGVNASRVQVRLVSSSLNVSVSGTQFLSRFLATPGSYVAYTTAAAGNLSYANLTTITVAANGVATPTISLLGSGTFLVGTLAPPTGYSLNGSTVAVTLLGPGGHSVPAQAVDGEFQALLPTGGSYRPMVNVTLPEPGPGGHTEYIQFRTSGLTTCPVSGNTSACSIPLSATIGLSTVYGSVSAIGSTLRPDGTLWFIDSTGARTSTTLSAGSYSVRLPPGDYVAYASAPGAGTMLAGLANVSVGNGSTALNLSLGLAWTDSLTVLPAPGGPALANISVSRTGFPVLDFTNEPVSTTIPLTLPAGTWTITARSSANAFGVRTASVATLAVTLLSGNAATTLALRAVLTSSVSIDLTGLTHTSALPGSTVRFTFGLVNTGSTPVTFHLLGSPVTWNFSFSPANFTLPAGATGVATSEVSIGLPANAPVAHPPIIIEAIASNNSILGSSTRSPLVDVAPEPGLEIGPNPRLSAISSDSVTVPFWAYNPGNVAESVHFAVGDAARIAGLGWTIALRSGASALPNQVSLSPGQNSSYSVLLSSPSGQALPPGTTTVLASVTNGSLSLQRSALLTVPGLTIGLTNSSIAITGPSIGSPPAYPSWLVPVLVFLPALAFLAAAASWRWWRTRRWVRR